MDTAQKYRDKEGNGKVNYTVILSVEKGLQGHSRMGVIKFKLQTSAFSPHIARGALWKRIR
jgi:hypothetical protein